MCGVFRKFLPTMRDMYVDQNPYCNFLQNGDVVLPILGLPIFKFRSFLIEIVFHKWINLFSWRIIFSTLLKEIVQCIRIRGCIIFTAAYFAISGINHQRKDDFWENLETKSLKHVTHNERQMNIWVEAFNFKKVLY